MTLSGTTFCTEQPGQLAVRIDSGVLGSHSIPASRWADSLTRACQKAGVTISWADANGRPVALLDLGARIAGKNGFQIEGVQLIDGEFQIAGSSALRDDRVGVGESAADVYSAEKRAVQR